MKDLINFEDVSGIDRLAMILGLKRIVEKNTNANIHYVFHYPNVLNQDTFYKLKVLDINNIEYYFDNTDESFDLLQDSFVRGINNDNIDYIVLPLCIDYVNISKEYVYILVFDKKYLDSKNLWVFTLDIFYEDNFFLNKILNHFVRSLNVRDDLVIITNTEKDVCPSEVKVENNIDFCVQWMFYFLNSILDNKNSTLKSVIDDMTFMFENEPEKITKFMYKLIFETINIIFDYRKELDQKNDVLILSFNIIDKEDAGRSRD